MRIDVLTIFPELFRAALGVSIPARAAGAGLARYHIEDIRDHTRDKHRKVDDRPFGGGPGMVMACQPIWDAVQHVEALDPTPATRVLLTPQGKRLDQPLVERLAASPRLLLIAPRYEGVDERVIEALRPMEISIGDYVLSGGELAALVLIDAVVRLLPGALGHSESAAQDSFSLHPAAGRRILDCPHYTQPREWEGRAVPPVLLSGDHGAIAKWRLEQAMQRTRDRRPDLLA
jgi:tRNA (guanine37-N1)-methyltransferase